MFHPKKVSKAGMVKLLLKLGYIYPFPHEGLFWMDGLRNWSLLQPKQYFEKPGALFSLSQVIAFHNDILLKGPNCTAVIILKHILEIKTQISCNGNTHGSFLDWELWISEPYSCEVFKF